ncbi:hypothetical protein F5X99DRAFT_387995 [Biscogniauxia marginata]|nr:hypothetical protein F5X99DRAFT_387995 [Biscogniauxia marginata]
MLSLLTPFRSCQCISLHPDIYSGPGETRTHDYQSKPPVVNVLTTRDPLCLPDPPRPPTPGPHPRPPPIPPRPPVPTPPPSPRASIIRFRNSVSQRFSILTSPIKPFLFPHPPRPPTPGPNRPGPVSPRPNVPTPPPSPRRSRPTSTQSCRKPTRESVSQFLGRSDAISTGLVLEHEVEDIQHRVVRPLKALPGRARTQSSTKSPRSCSMQPLVTLDQVKKRTRVEVAQMSSLCATRSTQEPGTSSGEPLLHTRPFRSVAIILTARFLRIHGSLKTSSSNSDSVSLGILTSSA